MKLKFLSKIAGLLIFGLSIYYLGDVLFDQARVLAERSYGASDILLIGVTSVIYGIILSLLSASWSTMIIKRPEDSFQGQNFRLLNAVYMKSAILKYLPSNVLHFAGRNLFARNMGYSQLKLGAATLFEILFQIFSAILLFSAVFSLLTGPLPQLYFQLILAAGVIALPLLFFLDPIFQFLAEKLPLLQKVVPSLPNNVPLAFLMNFASALGMALVAGYLASHIWPDQEITLLAMGSFSLAWLLGFLLPGAPGGMGVRESFLVLQLSAVTGEADAFIFAIAMRVVTILADLILYGFGLSLARISAPGEKTTAT